MRCSASQVWLLLYRFIGLILVKEPYYNEAGYENHRGTKTSQDNSKKYNEMVYLKSLQVILLWCLRQL